MHAHACVRVRVHTHTPSPTHVWARATRTCGYCAPLAGGRRQEGSTRQRQLHKSAPRRAAPAARGNGPNNMEIGKVQLEEDSVEIRREAEALTYTAEKNGNTML